MYLETYGGLIAERARAAFEPLHVPATDAVVKLDLKRSMLPAQEHAVTAAVKTLRTQKAVFLCGECGSGKTQMGVCAVQAHAAGKPYRAIVMCPPHLVGGPNGWATEVRTILPDVEVRVLENWWELLDYPRTPPTKPTWLIIGETKAKMAPPWAPAVNEDRDGVLHCPDCGAQIRRNADGEGLFATLGDLSKTKKRCQACKSPLWQFVRRPGKAVWPPASYIHKHMKGVFDYLICDELHQEKSDTSARANALGSLAAACRKVIGMTGTLSGGKASHVRSLLFRLCPDTLKAEGLRWEDSSEFIRRYGRVDRILTEKSGSMDNRCSKGKSKSQRESEQPGVMPTLFGRHIIGNTIFLSLEDVYADLPGYDELLVPVEISPSMAGPYRSMEATLTDAVKELLRKGSHKMLSKMLQALLAYPDYPYDWPEIGYVATGKDNGPNGRYVFVTQPPTLDRNSTWAKEKELLKIIATEKSQGRQCWVFCVYTKTHPVLHRLEQVIREAGHTVKVLDADKVPAKNRGAWIAANAKGIDVMISHPQPVGTGMTLFDKGGSYNFASLIFYETGYDLFALRQASRRSYRIGQLTACRVYFLYYKATMQSRAMDLMAAKLDSALALEGSLKADGLAAMAADIGGSTMELAKSLVGAINFNSAERVWKKCGLSQAKHPAILSVEEDYVAAVLKMWDMDDDDDEEEVTKPSDSEDDYALQVIRQWGVDDEEGVEV